MPDIDLKPGLWPRFKSVWREYWSYPTKMPKTRGDWSLGWVMVLAMGLFAYLRHKN